MINFRKLTLADLPLMHHWLNHIPEVRDFWGDNKDTAWEAVVAKYAPRIRGESPTTPYFIWYGDTPIGCIQAYRWRDYPDYSRYLDLTEEAGSLDVFIGEPAYLHQGLGPHVLTAFLRTVIFADETIESCVIIAEARNASALRAYEKTGFQCLRVMDHPDEPGPVCLLRLTRAEFTAKEDGRDA